MKNRPTTRRDFLKSSALLGAGVALSGRRALAHRSPNEKLDIGIVGVANRGAANLGGVQGENVVALCDVDLSYLARAAERFPKAALYTDFRRMIDAEKLDAVVVSTPDHTHAPATARALRAGLHVYCEKPLTRTVHEARVVAELAAEQGLVTQMGTQIHAMDNYRRVVELIQGGAIGDVSEAHVFCNKSWSASELPQGTQEVPEHLRYDLWLGPVERVPYHSEYLPANWRRYWAFGGGTLGDMACHYMDLPFWALELTHPQRVETTGPPAHPHCAPKSLGVRYTFARTRTHPQLQLTWSDGGLGPAVLSEWGVSDWKNGVFFIGAEGALIADYTRRKLLPEERFAAYDAPTPSIPPSIGHHLEWIEACKSGGPTTCNFGYSGRLTETVLLGAVAHRVGQPIEWDARSVSVKNAPEAERLVRAEYREGWEL